MDVTEGLAVRGLDDLIDVEPRCLSELGELVGQCDVDIPVCGLGQFGQLGCLGAAKVPYAVRARRDLVVRQNPGPICRMLCPLAADASSKPPTSFG